MELTREYFDKGLSNLIEQISSEVASKEDLTKFETRIQDYTMQAFEIQQEYLDERFKELVVVYDVRDRVSKLEKDFLEFKTSKIRPSH